MIERMTSTPHLFKKDNWITDETRKKTIDHFHRQVQSFDWNHGLKVENCPVLSVAHGTSRSKANKIIVGGFASLSTLDSGFYGKGIYFSSSAIYTIPYCSNAKDPCILICFLLPGNPYPVIESPFETKNNFTGKHILHGYQSHYIVTKADGLPFNFTDPKFIGLSTYNEIVINQESQVVPIFIVDMLFQNVEEIIEILRRENLPVSDDNQISTPQHDKSITIVDGQTNDYVLLVD